MRRLLTQIVALHKTTTKTAIARSRKRTPTQSAPKQDAESKATKQDTVIALLRRQDGASIAEIVGVTDCQPHSARGFLSGVLKRRLKIAVISEKSESGERRYHIAPAQDVKVGRMPLADI